MKNEKKLLWAPWRIEFIRSEKSDDCFLCIAKSGSVEPETEKMLVYRGENTFVMLNRYPYNSGHLLIAPYSHSADICDLTATERHELIDLAAQAKDVLQKVMNPDAFNCGFNLGAAAGAGVVDHVHMHVVPRWNGDTNFMPVIADSRVVPEALEATANLIREAWND